MAARYNVSGSRRRCRSSRWCKDAAITEQAIRAKKHELAAQALAEVKAER
jgi:hypothetical protein